MRRLDVPLPPEPACAPSQNSREHAALNANSDMNMVIILAALLGAMICAVCINLIVRCTFRCCHRRVTLAGPPKERTGLKKRELSKIPKEVYRKTGNEDAQVTECLICLSEFTDGEMYRVLPVCRHRFHMRCIDKWLGSHSTCPTCRRSALLDWPKWGFGWGCYQYPIVSSGTDLKSLQLLLLAISVYEQFNRHLKFDVIWPQMLYILFNSHC